MEIDELESSLAMAAAVIEGTREGRRGKERASEGVAGWPRITGKPPLPVRA